jgi:hypothetical protein
MLIYSKIKNIKFVFIFLKRGVEIFEVIDEKVLEGYARVILHSIDDKERVV